MEPDAGAPVPTAGFYGEMPEPPPLPGPELDLQSFPELLEWLIGTRYRSWAVRTYHPSSTPAPGERPSCTLMARVLLSVGDLPGGRRGSPIESTYADALQQLRKRSARRLPEECLERTVSSLRLDDEWRALLAAKAAEWDSGKACRHYRKDAVEDAIKATLAPQKETPPGDSAKPRAGARWAVSRSPGRTVVAIIALVVIAVAVVAGIKSMLGEPTQTREGTAAADTAASGQPQSMDSPGGVSPEEMRPYLFELETLMAQAGHGRLRIGKAVEWFENGRTSKASAVQMIQTVIDNRNAALAALATVAVPADVRARECHDAFRKALQYSLRADECYLDYVAGWASLSSARPDNQQAARWKLAFVDRYNQLAAECRLAHDWTIEDF